MLTLAIFLQVVETVAVANDAWSVLREVGGAAGILFGIVVVVLWRDNKAKEKHIEALNVEGRKDAKEGARLMGSVENLIENLLDKYDNGEKRIVASIEREARAIKQLVHAEKQKLIEKSKTDGQNP